MTRTEFIDKWIAEHQDLWIVKDRGRDRIHAELNALTDEELWFEITGGDNFPGFS